MKPTLRKCFAIAVGYIGGSTTAVIGMRYYWPGPLIVVVSLAIMLLIMACLGRLWGVKTL
jgi:hypothetical protein